MLIGVRGVKAVGPRLVSQFNIAKFSLAPKKNTRKLVLFIQEINVIFDEDSVRKYAEKHTTA